MRIESLGVTALVLAAGCGATVPGVDCDKDSDCSAGHCVDRVCVHRTHCAPACEAHQDCVEGSCIAAFDAIDLLAPRAGERLSDGFVLTAALVAHPGSGRALPAAIDVRITPSSGPETAATLPLDATTQRYSSRIEVERGGSYTLRVLYPSSSLAAQVSVQVDRCADSCAPDRECFADQCAPAFDRIAFVSPTAGSWTDPPLHVEARLERCVGALRAFPESLAARATDPAGGTYGAALAHAGDGVYRGDLATAGGGEYRLRAWIEGSDLAAQIEVTVNACGAPCAAGAECLGAACMPPFAKLEIVAPGADDSVPLEFIVDARVVRTPGSRTAFPATLALTACRAGLGCVPATLPRADESGLYSDRMRVAVGGHYLLRVEYADAGLATNVPFYVDHCAATCTANQVCLEQSCQLAFTDIAIREPANGTRVETEVAIAATMTPARKSIAPPGSLQLEARHLATGTVESATLTLDTAAHRYAGRLAPARGGAFELHAVWRDGTGPLLSSPPLTIVETRCETDCGPWKECVEGQCANLFRGVAIETPAASSTQGPSVRVRAHLDRALESAKPNPPSLQGSARPSSGGTEEIFPLAQVGATDDFEGPWSPAIAGAYEVIVRVVETAQQSAAVPVTIDKTPPRFAISWTAPARRANETDPATGYAAALRRDEIVVVRVTSPDEDVDVTTVELRVRGATGLGSKTVSVVPGAGTCGGTCLEAAVDLADAAFEMNAFRGTYSVEVTGKDVRGNQPAAPTVASIPVTRWKWAYDGQSGPIKTAPAVGATGRVYVGTALNAAPWGRALALNADGTLAWSFQTDGPVEASPAVGTLNGSEAAVVAGTHRNTSNALEGAVWVLDGTSTSQAPACVGGIKSTASPATTLSQLPGDAAPVFTVIGLLESGITSQVVGARINATVLACSMGLLPAEPDPLPGIAAYGTSAVFADRFGRLYGLQLGSLGTWSIITGFPVQVSAGQKLASIIVSSSVVVGTAAGVGLGAFFRVPMTGISGATVQTASAIGRAVLDRTHTLLAGADDGQLHSAPELMTSHSAVPLSTLPSDNTIAVAAPAIGSDSTIYITTQGGKLLARTSTGAPLWEAPLGAGSDSSPALDCARDSTGTAISRPGVLYVGADDGKLYAFVVDSHGIDTSAPWPKFHRDPQNSADASRNLSQFTCP